MRNSVATSPNHERAAGAELVIEELCDTLLATDGSRLSPVNSNARKTANAVN